MSAPRERRPVPLPVVALVTDRRRAGGADALIRAVVAAVENGVNLVQLRERDLPDAQMLVLAGRLRAATDGRALLFVNDSVSVAEASGSDGVQLGERSRSVASARAAMARPLLVGRSVHDAAGALAAVADGADLLLAGAVYASPTHPGQAPAGTDLIAQLAATAPVPVIGIGGITARNAAPVIEAGASGAAVASAVLGSPDPGAAARDLSEAVARAWAGRDASSDEAGPVMRLVVNGSARELAGPLTLAQYLETLGLAGRYVAVAHNGEVLERERFGAVTLADGDRLEIVRPVGGG